MRKVDVLTKALAWAGTLLAWLPLLAPVFFSATRLIQAGVFKLDYLMPAELFPLVLAGGALLVWAALRARRRVKLIAGSLALAAALLAASMALAQVSGLATGEIEPAGIWWVLVLAALGLYILMALLVAAGGARLLRDLYGQAPAAGR